LKGVALTTLRHIARRSARLLLVGPLVALVTAPQTAGATGFMVARFGGERGNPITDNPTALYYNPAGIVFAHGTNLYVEGLFAYRSLSFDRDAAGIDNPGATPGTPDINANSGAASLGNIVASPFIGITSDLGVPDLGVGVSVSVPFGGSASWDKRAAYAGNAKYPGAVDGAQRWWDIEGQIMSVYFTAAGAYRLPGNVSVGLAANVVSSKTFDLRAANADGRDDLVGANGEVLEGRALLDTSGISFSLGLGAAWEPTPEWRLGLSYQSQPGFGTVNESGTLQKKLGLTAPTHNDIEHRYSLPDVLRLGVSYRPTMAIELRAWGSFERWSTFTSECIVDKSVSTRDCNFTARGVPVNGSAAGVINNIPRGWQDSGSVRVSGSYFLMPTVELQLGLGLDGNAVPDATLETSLPDEMKVNVTAGAVFRDLIAQNLLLHVAYSQFIGFDRTIAPRARVGGMGQSPYDFPSRVPDSAGKYGENIGVLTVGVGYTF
jgi:long-chain fatty acid transport protein